MSRKPQWDDEWEREAPKKPLSDRGKKEKHRRRLTDLLDLEDEEFDDLYDYSRKYTR